MYKDIPQENNNLDQAVFSGRSITAEDIFQAGFDSDNPKWFSIIQQIITISTKQLFDELMQWVNINKGNNDEIIHVVNPFKKIVEQERKKLTFEFVKSEILAYNKNLEIRGLDGFKRLQLEQNELPHEYMRVVNYMFETVDECFKLLGKHIDIKIVSEAEDPETENVGFKVDHKLRWNSAKGKSFNDFFEGLIKDELIQTHSGGGDRKIIMDILNATFEQEDVPKLKAHEGKIKGFKLLIKKPVYIPEKLIWTLGGKDFADYFAALFNNFVIFIDKPYSPQREKVSAVMQQIIFIEGIEDRELENSSLVTYLKERSRDKL